MISLNRLVRGRIGVLAAGPTEREVRSPDSRRRITRRIEAFEALLERSGAEAVRYTAPDGAQICATPEAAYAAGAYFKKADVDLLFLFLAEGASPGRFMQGVLACPAPLVLADGTDGGESAWNAPWPVPEACAALKRCLRSPSGMLPGGCGPDGGFTEDFVRETAEWCRAAAGLRAFRGAIFGHLGHVPEGRLGVNFDPTAFTGAFGAHIRTVEMCQLAECVDRAAEEETGEKRKALQTVLESYPSRPPVEEAAMTRTAACAAGLEKLMRENNLSGLAFHYEGREGGEYRRIASALPLAAALLAGQGHILADGSDLRACMALYAASALGAGGTLMAMRTVRAQENALLSAPAFSVASGLRGGPVTAFSLCADEENRFSFLAARGEMPEDSETETGRVRLRFGPDIQRFLGAWSEWGGGSRFVLSSGHTPAALEKLSRLLGIPFRQIG